MRQMSFDYGAVAVRKRDMSQLEGLMAEWSYRSKRPRQAP
jgi:hypothetical protein